MSNSDGKLLHRTTTAASISHHIDGYHDPTDDPSRHHPQDEETGSNTPIYQSSDQVEKGTFKLVHSRKESYVAPEIRVWKNDIITFDTKDDPQNPMNWPYRKKIIVTMLFGLTTMTSTFGSSIISPGNQYIAREFGISSEVAVLTISLFVLGYVPGPVVWAPFSELYGRAPSVFIPMFCFLCFTAGSATAANVQTLMITRFFAGFFASAPVSNVGGGLADMFDQRSRATAVVLYSLAVVAGPTIAPVIGGAVSQSYLGWRWTEYLTIILTGAVLFVDIMFLPETFAPVILARKAKQLRIRTGRWALHGKHEENDFSLKHFVEKNLALPLKMIVWEPMVLAITLYNAFAYGVLYLLFAAVPIVFEQQRGYNSLVGSLPFLGVLVGTLTGAALNLGYSQFYFIPYIDSHEGRAPPEKRLPPMMLGSILFPIGFFLLGWTSDPSIFWLPSVLGLTFIGASFLLIFQSGINYLLDAYTNHAASAVGANTFMRSLLAAALPLVAEPLFDNVGVHWACTLLGCLAILFAGVPFLFYFYGARLRAMSKMTVGPTKE